MLIFGVNIVRLQIPPSIAQTKNILEGENRSANVNKAKVKVPTIKPNCTKEIKYPNKSKEVCI